MRLLRLFRKLPRLGSLSPAELRDLAAAQLAILDAHRRVRSRPLGELVAVANAGTTGGPDVENRREERNRGGPGRTDGSGTEGPSGDAVPTAEPDAERAGRAAWAVLAASNYGLTRPTCLVRSLAIQSLLRKRGLPPGEIKIGVRWQDDRFEAHAWVEQGERVLGDTRRHVRTFEPVTDMTAVRF